ncbi:MAG: hypothetical protein Q9227_009501 [Pyrenula ochraceoflavens]
MGNKAFSATEKAALKVNTFNEFDAFWSQVNGSKQKLNHGNREGHPSLSKSYQKSASVAYDFMQSFSPIIGLVKDFAAPYGGLAIGTLSLLFIVAKNKNDIEERLNSTMISIQERLPGLRMYQHIYNDNHELDILLQERIVSTYCSFVDFSIAATKYYKKSRFHRNLEQWLKAIGPQYTFVENAKRLEDDVVRMRYLCEDLLNKNVDELKNSNKELDAQLKHLQSGRDNDRVRDIQRLLNLEDFSEELQRREVDKYHKELADDDQLNIELLQQMKEKELKSFRIRPKYNQWITSPEPRLLIILGYNNESIISEDQCWLSPVATTLIKDLIDAHSGPTVAYNIIPRPRKSIFDVLPTILLQLLRQKSQALRNEKQFLELQSELRNFHAGSGVSRSPDNHDAMLSALQNAALRVISFFDEAEPIFIIVDRVDRCQDLWSHNRVDHRLLLLRVFVKLVEVARTRLKILAIINGFDWPHSKNLGDLECKSKDRLAVHEEHQEYAQ